MKRATTGDCKRFAVKKPCQSCNHAIGKKAWTAPVAVVNFMNYEGWEWGKIAAGGSLVMAPVLIFSLAVRRYLVSGLTAGAVKG